MFDRGRLRRVGQAVRIAPDEPTGASLVANELDEWFEAVMKPDERKALYSRIASNVRATPLGENQVTKADFMGAWVSFWLVVLSSLPAAVPFLIWDDARFALRVSNGILLALLFLTGFLWARKTLGKPWLVGLGFLVVGFGLVAMAIALGG
jgi:VIT1/CCC1 family predicted Fe2+/Mn2+ transporter